MPPPLIEQPINADVGDLAPDIEVVDGRRRESASRATGGDPIEEEIESADDDETEDEE